MCIPSNITMHAVVVVANNGYSNETSRFHVLRKLVTAFEGCVAFVSGVFLKRPSGFMANSVSFKFQLCCDIRHLIHKHNYSGTQTPSVPFPFYYGQFNWSLREQKFI